MRARKKGGSAVVVVEVSEAEYEELKRDRQRLDYVQSLGGKYTGRYVLRMSEDGRGVRLHETSREESSPTIREAIDEAMGE